LAERFPVGYQYHVSTRVDLTGTLTPEAEKGKPVPKPLAVTGQSAIEYDERVLTADKDGVVDKTIRVYRRIDFDRKVGERKQQNTLRPAVRRLVVLRRGSTEVPFSPDGPLVWGEIDLVRTDVFTPALAGLLPTQAVRIGDKWTATTAAVQELTDMERIEDGKLECKLEQITALPQAGKLRRHARIGITGTVQGINEDGPNRQQLDGYFYFDLESNHISYVSLKGVQVMLDKSKKELGRVEGRFVLTRQLQQSKDLSDAALKSVAVEPDAKNTLLLYEDAQLGVRFLYPRRWHIAASRGQQVALDAADGSGLLMTFEPLARVPTAAQYLAESRDWMKKQKAKVLREDRAQAITGGAGAVERFSLEVEVSGQRAHMDYYVLRQKTGGGTAAARLLEKDLADLRKEVEEIVRSVTITKK
jgi:hypothetical protein